MGGSSIKIGAGFSIYLQRTIVFSRAGPLETITTGQPVSFSMNSTYLRAFSGSSSKLRALEMSHFQPGRYSQTGLHFSSTGVTGKFLVIVPSSVS